MCTLGLIYLYGKRPGTAKILLLLSIVITYFIGLIIAISLNFTTIDTLKEI
jgi:hypothetical protein